MKISFYLTCFFLACFAAAHSQSVGVGTLTPHASAQLDITHPAKGVLIPRMTSSAINAIAGPARGLLVYDSLNNQLMVNKGDALLPDWQPVGSNSGNAANAWGLSGNSGTNPATHFIGNTDNLPLLFRVNNEHAGKLDSVNRITFFGYQAGNGSSNRQNTAFGFHALRGLTLGTNNAAVGGYALYANSTGSFNSSFGDYSMANNQSGSYNSAFGYGSLNSNSTGTNNTAIGYRALYFNTTGSSNTAIGYGAMDFNTTGIANIAIGNGSMYKNSTGLGNTAVGVSSLFSNADGIYNAALGSNALQANVTGTYNVAIGAYSLFKNTSGQNNAALGSSTLFSNTTGVNNTVAGNSAMYSNSIGNDNVALGIEALFTNSTGSKNSATGWRSMYLNTTGYFNAAYGDGAMYSNTTGYGNTSVGSGALYYTTAASYNTTLGYHAGFSNDLGWNNTLIGAECNVNASGIYNSVALGNGVNITGNGQARIGNFGTTSIGGYQAWSHLSDGRFKKNIKEDVPGLDFILKLRPVTYQLDIFSFSKSLNKEAVNSPNEYMVRGMKENEKMIQTGFIAQEVEEAAKTLGYDFSGVDRPQHENDYYGLRYASFVVPLVKSVQEQQKQLTALKEQNQALLDRIEKLESLLSKK